MISNSLNKLYALSWPRSSVFAIAFFSHILEFKDKTSFVFFNNKHMIDLIIFAVN